MRTEPDRSTCHYKQAAHLVGIVYADSVESVASAQPAEMVGTVLRFILLLQGTCMQAGCSGADRLRTAGHACTVLVLSSQPFFHIRLHVFP